MLTVIAALALQAPLHRAHSHNDYLHPRPLHDALELGFCSVEADIFLDKGELMVAHTRDEIKPDRTLRRLYLEPLAKRIKANQGRIHPGTQEFILLVDVKGDGEKVLPVLLKQLEPLEPHLTRYSAEKVRRGAISVILSGDRPIAAVKELQARTVGAPLAIDGRLSDLEGDASASLMPLVSQGWSARFKWNGEGEFPSGERTLLRSFVDKAHAQGRKIRFWASPDKPSAWKELYEAEVDLINTDQLAGLSKFLRGRSAAR